MHISDGVLSPAVIAFGWIVSIVFIAFSFKWAQKQGSIAEQIPKLSVFTAAFFVASLIHINVPPTSVHLILNGLLGVVLGALAYPAMFIGLVLQALLFQHGGITTIGINSFNVGVPALISYVAFRKGSAMGLSKPVIGGICGGLAILLTTVFLALVLITAGEQFEMMAKLVIIPHMVIMVIEAVITASVVAYLAKVKPELLPLDKEDNK
jgi:cobalt/nickel transport system permease protein